jgi:hypothetical protein
MLVGMVLSCFLSMMPGVHHVPVRAMGVVRTLLVATAFVMFCRFAMMFRSMIVMLGGLHVMLCTLVFRHGVLTLLMTKKELNLCDAIATRIDAARFLQATERRDCRSVQATTAQWIGPGSIRHIASGRLASRSLKQTALGFWVMDPPYQRASLFARNRQAEPSSNARFV